MRTAAMNYLLDSGVHWGAAPAVKVSTVHCTIRMSAPTNSTATALYFPYLCFLYSSKTSTLCYFILLFFCRVCVMQV